MIFASNVCERDADSSSGGSGGSGLLRLGGAELEACSGCPFVLDNQPSQPGPPFAWIEVDFPSGSEASLLFESLGCGGSGFLVLFGCISSLLPRLNREFCEPLISACSSTTVLGFDVVGDEMEPLEVALTLVVVASAGGDRLEVAFPSVNCREGVRLVFGLAGRLTDETTSEAVLLAEDILSRALWVIGAVLRGQVLLYQLYDHVSRISR